MKLKLLIEILMLTILLVTTGYFAFLAFKEVPVHDVAVVDAYADLTHDQVVGVIKNEGTQIENLNVTAYRNGTTMETRYGIALSPGTSKTLSFPWNATHLSNGNYSVRVIVSTVQGEMNVDDNSFTVLVEVMHVRDVSIFNAFPNIDGTVVALVTNQGDRSETFNVTAFSTSAESNMTIIGTQNVNGLPPNANRILKFPWNTSDLLHSNYTVNVVANIVPDEMETADNSFAFTVEIGSTWRTQDYFNFTAISTDASSVGSGEIQMRSLHFNITSIVGDAHNVTLFINGMTEPIHLSGILYRTSKRVDIEFQTPYQTQYVNNSYPVEMVVTSREVDPKWQLVILPVPPQNGSAYTIWRGADRYYAKNDWSQMIHFWGANFTHVFQQVLNAFPKNSSGTINLEPGFYEGRLVINRSGITVQGQGVFCDNPKAMPNGTRKLPDDSPEHLMGTVLIVNVAGQDGIHLGGQLTGVQINNLGIEFTQNITGHGISDDMDQNYHLSYCYFEKIMVLNHDKSHYAIRLSNFLHLDVKDIWSWGGPLINLYGNMPGFQAGNSNFYNIYGYMKYDLAPVEFVEGPYPIFIHKNDSLGSVWINFLYFYRIQINCPFTQTDSDFCVFTLWDCRSSKIVGLDLEGSGHIYEGNKLKMGSCYNVEFDNAYMWSMINNIHINVASNNERNTFENCLVGGGTVLDSSPTDTWRGCIIEGTINLDSQAHFMDLSGNWGSATLTVGSIELNVTAKFLQNFSLITVVPYLNANQSLTITAKYCAPSNTFTVACADRQPADEDIVFFWTVQS
jgi:hypothetical protein